MNLAIASLIIASVAISAVAQLCLKYGMSNGEVQAALTDAIPLEIARAIGMNVFVVSGLTLYALGAVLWLGVLARIDLSLAYPFVALGFIFTMVLSVLFLGEHITAPRLIGTVIIGFGVVVLTRG